MFIIKAVIPQDSTGIPFTGFLSVPCHKNVFKRISVSCEKEIAKFIALAFLPTTQDFVRNLKVTGIKNPYVDR